MGIFPNFITIRRIHLSEFAGGETKPLTETNFPFYTSKSYENTSFFSENQRNKGKPVFFPRQSTSTRRCRVTPNSSPNHTLSRAPNRLPVVSINLLSPRDSLTPNPTSLQLVFYSSIPLVVLRKLLSLADLYSVRGYFGLSLIPIPKYAVTMTRDVITAAGCRLNA